MQLSRDLAGFSMAESDKIRKAIGKKDAALMESIGSKFIEQTQAGWITVELKDGTRREVHAAARFPVKGDASLKLTVDEAIERGVELIL